MTDTLNTDVLSEARAREVLAKAYEDAGRPESADRLRKAWPYATKPDEHVALTAMLAFAKEATPPASDAAVPAGERTEVERIVRWVDQAIERADSHKNTEGVWLFAKQWRVVRDALATATKVASDTGAGLREAGETIAGWLQQEQDRLDAESGDYLMDTADCINVIREKIAALSTDATLSVRSNGEVLEQAARVAEIRAEAYHAIPRVNLLNAARAGEAERIAAAIRALNTNREDAQS